MIELLNTDCLSYMHGLPDNAGFDFVGCELDPDYFAAAQKRYDNHTKQGNLIL